MPSDPRKLRPAELVRLLNSTPLGQVINERKLRQQREAAGARIGDDKTVDLLRYTAWLAAKRHATLPAESPKPAPPSTPTAAALHPMPGGPGPGDERMRDADRKRIGRGKARLCIIPPCENLKRRVRLEEDDEAWLMHYFGPNSEVADPFTYKFVEQQLVMIAAISSAIDQRDDQAIAASRGEGKTTLAERLLLKKLLEGKVPFGVLFAATRPMAADSLDTIREALAENPLLLADYPEVCAPIVALESIANRARGMVVSGQRHDTGEEFHLHPAPFKWAGQEIILPRVPGAPAAGAILAVRGLDCAVRGLKRRGRRPTVAVVDDPDTEKTVANVKQAEKLERRIEKGIGGLGDQTGGIGIVFLSTCQSRLGGVTFKFCDPSQKPTFKGKRFRFLVTKPERMDLWDEYVQLFIQEMQAFSRGDSTDKYARGAHAFYLANFEAMNAGAVVGNPNRFRPKPTPDGTPREVSALQHYFNRVAEKGADWCATELDNDPAEETGGATSAITQSKIQLRLSGFERMVVPRGCEVVTQGIDLKKSGLHYVVRGWMSDASCYTVDYNFNPTYGTSHGSDEGVEEAVRRVILDRFEQIRQKPYRDVDGRIVPVNLTLIDSGWLSHVVYKVCAEIGVGVYPSKGHGKSEGCATPNFQDVVRATRDRKPGDGWFMSRLAAQRWLVHCDADRWKAFEHARWLTPEGQAGAAYIFGEMTEEERLALGRKIPREAKDHFGYAREIVAEIEFEEMVRGVLKRGWKKNPGHGANHYLDASYLSDVAAAMLGVSLAAAPSTHVLPEARPPQAGGWFAKQTAPSRPRR